MVKATDLFYKDYPHLAKQVEVIIRTGQIQITRNLLFHFQTLYTLVKVSETPMLGKAHLDYINKANKTISGRMPKSEITLGDFFLCRRRYTLGGMTKDKQVNQYYKNESLKSWKKYWCI